MKNFEYLAALLYSIDAEWNKRLAAIVDSSSFDFYGVGTHTADGGFETAAVNVVQNLPKVDMARCWLVCTYPPTAMCRGMAEVRKIGGIVYLDAAKVIRIVALEGSDLQITKDNSATLEAMPAWASIATWIQGMVAAQKGGRLTQRAFVAWKTINLFYDKKQPVFEHRLTPVDVQEIFTDLPDTKPSPAPLSVGNRESIFMNLAFALVGQTWTNLTQWNRSKPGQVMGGTNIGAVLVCQDQILGWGLNLLAQNSTFHAETIMLQSYLAAGKTVPENCEIYTTLQPCDMCAGLITRVGKGVKVIYGLRDGGLRTVLTDGANECSERAAVLKKGTTDMLADHQRKRQGRTPEYLAAESTADFFKQFPKWLLERRRQLAATVPSGQQPSQATANEMKCLDQSIELLRIAGRRGLTTSQGMGCLLELFPELKPPVAVAAAVPSVNAWGQGKKLF